MAVRHEVGGGDGKPLDGSSPAALAFGENLRSARVARGLSQERLATACRLHRTEISLLERGAREPRLSTIMRLARGLGVAPGTLLDGVD